MGGAERTWQGGKRGREVAPSSPFASLKPLVGEADNPAKGLEMLSDALRGYPNPLRLHVRLVSGEEDDESVEQWEVQAGTDGFQAAADGVKRRRRDRGDAPRDVDAYRPGRPGPYEALYTGRLRVGGDFEAAKAVTRYLSDSGFVDGIQVDTP
jgi:hypothetical protein